MVRIARDWSVVILSTAESKDPECAGAGTSGWSFLARNGDALVETLNRRGPSTALRYAQDDDRMRSVGMAEREAQGRRCAEGRDGET